MRFICIALAVCACAWAVSVDLETPMELANAELPGRSQGKMSLIQLRENALMAVRGQAAMTDAMAMKAKHTFIKLVAGFKSETIKSDSIATIRLAQHVLLGEGEGTKVKDQGSGLDLIFRKLNELKKKIETEQEVEKKQNDADNAGCTKDINDNNGIIESSSKARRDNADTVAKAHVTITESRALWRKSRNLEDDTHKSLVQMQAARAEASDAIRARVDERNKGIDVMVKATFMVCERFNRYKDTPQCIEIKSQPDVDEPHRYETKPYDKAKAETEETHKDGDPPSKWVEKWKKQMEADIKLKGKDDPEGLLKDAKPAVEPAEEKKEAPAKKTAAKLEKKEAARLREAANDDLVSLLSEEEGTEAHQTSLSASEAQACRELKLMTDQAKLPHRYALPLTELALSIKAGETKRSKSIVEILISVLKETRQEQANDKAKHQAELDKFYAQSWEHMKILLAEYAFQAETRATMEKKRVQILQRMADSEEQRNNELKAVAARTTKEDACAIVNEEYGVREMLRLEDLENLAKLKSLLRALYDKKMPVNCPKHNRVLCTSKDNGWCIYTGKSPSNEQRCSCNVGFYGDACQFRMCPGLSKNLYTADAPGSCSDRGDCNPLDGVCKCKPGFYKGPKNACEFKHTPKDLQGNPDTCSNRGQVDKIRGKCWCDTVPPKEPDGSKAKPTGKPNIKYYGEACEQMKCPNSNGVLYPVVSGNACNGRGACSVKNGKCTCKPPYFGKSCEFENCPEDCRGKGTCDTSTGKCACRKGFRGHACEFVFCPNDCSGGGKCNRNDGICTCSMGYSGVACDKTTRCTAPNLNNDKMNWWTVWDKPGWMVCPKGQLLYQLKRSGCQALSCIESGGCAAGCEGREHVFQLRHCYHDLRWYTSFDKAGWSKCLPDYYVAGLFRSCESLYCLNMAKCCSLKEARWADCGAANWAANFNGPGTGKMPNGHVFITGFRRDEGHKIADIEEASYCGFVRGY